MRTAGKVVLGGAFAAFIGIAGLGGYNLYTGMTGRDTTAPQDGPDAPTPGDAAVTGTPSSGRWSSARIGAQTGIKG
ncbi:hypothetical protein [Streptomyces sp. NPDC005336]|uniref:hypothetical protein n=1 Tax=Streptomyces sp. NPDC005336 TaxID=3157035 RepID=UPI0033BBA56E